MVVRMGRLELPRASPLVPEPGVHTASTVDDQHRALAAEFLGAPIPERAVEVAAGNAGARHTMTHRSQLALILSAIADRIELGASLTRAVADVVACIVAAGGSATRANGEPVDMGAWYARIVAHHLGVPVLVAWEVTHTPEQAVEVLRGFARFRGTTARSKR